MSRLRKFILVLTIFILALPTLVVSFAAPAVNPITFTIGSPDSASRYPIGLEPGVDGTSFPNFAAGGVYQQVYDKSAFAGPITITQLAFASSPAFNTAAGTAEYNFDIAMYATNAGPNGLSTDLAANRGTHFAPVFSGPVVANLTASNQFDLVIDITPYTYDPAHGNLLLELTMNAPPQYIGSPTLYFRAGSDPRSSRAANPANVPGGAFTDSFGLLTRFTGTGVAPAQVTLGNLVQTFDGNPKSVSVTTNPTGLNFTVTYNGSPTAPTNAGDYAVTAIVNDLSFVGQANGTLTIQPANQQITFDALPNKAIGDTDFDVSATASSNLPVSFSASDNCTIAGTQVHITGVGSCTITASQGGNSNYNPATPVARTIAIGKLDQQITFDVLPNRAVGDADFNVNATASSTLAVGFSASGDCTITGTQVHLTGAGTCTITASQDGDATYNPAAPVARTFAIGKLDQQIAFDALSDKSFGDADFNVSATASSSLTVSFSASDNCAITGSQVHLTGAGTCTITASQDGDADYNPAAPVGHTFTIGKADQQITFDTLPKKSVGDADFNVSATASSNLAVSFSASDNCTIIGTQVHLTGAGLCTITASQDGNADYNPAAPVAHTFTIGKADQQISFDALPDKSFGDADFTVNATASSSLSVSFAADGSCTLVGAQVQITGAGSCTITASQDGDASYNPATPVARTFAIGRADQQITFDTLANKSLGDADFSVSATASSNLVVSFSASDNCSITGTQVHLTGAGPCTISASQAGNADYNPAAPVAHSFTIGKADQQITFDALPNKSFGDADFNVNATASSNLVVSFTASDNCTITGTQVHLTGVGPCTITAAQDGDSNYNQAAPVARTFEIGKADQQISFDVLPNRAFGDADFDVSATASSNLTVSFSASDNCTITGTQVHLTGTGPCTITASQDGNGNYNPAAPVARTFTIAKADQQITFAALSNKAVNDADFNVSATASSNLAVSFSADGSCTVTGTQVRITGIGACTITGAQEGNSNYNPATPVARTFTIGKTDQQITFDTLADKKFGDADFNVGATASSNLAVSFSASGNCTLSGSQVVHLTGAGACTITASQDGDANTNAAAPVARTFSIGKADQQITFDPLPDKTSRDADFSVGATASSNLAVTFVAGGNCTMAGTQVHITGIGPCTITASQGGNVNYNQAAPVSQTFTIGKADQQITFEALADRKFGDADFNVNATASSNLAVSFAASGNCTIAGTQVHISGAGFCTITASQDGNAGYNEATPVARTFALGKADQQISFGALPNKTVADADFNVSATTSSNLAVSFSAIGNCTIAGTQVHLTGVGPCSITASQDGDANYNPATQVVQAFTISKADQQISFDPLSNKAVGDADFNVSATASSNLAVSFAASGNCTITGAQVHITGAGSCTVTASQDGNSNYNAATTVARTFAIGKVDQQITFAALPNKAVGDADFNVSATSSSNLAVNFSATGNCTIAGSQVHITGAGSCTITASQEGDSNYNPANPVARTFGIGKVDQQIIFDVLSNKSAGDGDFNVSATASSNLTVSFTAAGNCTIAGSQVHIIGAGSCTITASQEGNSNYNPATPVARTFSIGKVDQQITFDALSNKSVGDADFNVSGTASSNLAVSFTAAGNCTIAGSQVHITGAGSCTVTASQDGNSIYNAATPVARTLGIGKADQQISFPALPDRMVGDADFNVNATASSNLPVSFSASGNCSIAGVQLHIAGAGTCTITASQGGDSNYNSAPAVSQTFSITQIVNGAPDAVDDALTGVAEDSGARTIAIASLLANDNSGPGEESGQTLTFSIVGSSEVGGKVTTDGTNVYFTPAANFNGLASFQYMVTDNGSPAPKSDTATASFTVTEQNDEPISNSETLAPALEDAGTLTIPFVALTGNDLKGPADESGQTLIVKTVGNAVGGTVSIVGGNVLFKTAAGYNGTASFDYTVEDNGTSNGAADPRTSGTATARFNIIALADTPLVTNATTDANTQTTSGLVISRNPADGPEVTHFRISGITSGSLFKQDGITPVHDGDFISVAEGNAGLRFTPGTLDGSFMVQSSTSASDTGLQGGIATATITINPVVQPTVPVLRFSSNVYSVNEGAGFKTITVERTGDTSQAVAVDYVSSDHSSAAAFLPCTSAGDGFASSRCDFTTAIGTLRFAAGETSKTFNLLINEDNYVEGPEMVELTLFNPTAGAELGAPSTATVEITDDVTEGTTNPVDTSVNFVTAQYHDVLNREPDAPGLAFWTDNIEKCKDAARRPAGQTVAQCIDKQRESTAIAFFMSPEFQMTGGFVFRLYKGSLPGFPNFDGSGGRYPTTRQFIRDLSKVSEGIVVNNQIDGAVVEANRNRLAEEFVLRPEFDAMYGGLNNTLYVEQLLNTTGISQEQRKTAGTNSMAELKQELVEGLTRGTETRGSVLRKIVDGTVVIGEDNVQFTTPYGQAFYEQEYQRMFVYMEYVGYLRRNPDAAGFVFWLGKMNHFGGDPFQAEMVRSFILSPEYRSRFGQP
jgi:hypothetical protein